VTVVVADRGVGIAPNPGGGGPGLGLPLIASLADALQIEHSPTTGSRLRMTFHADGDVRSAEAA
jgi:anti-sigma regulatory factor (Ser/Thr protein kinase)